MIKNCKINLSYQNIAVAIFSLICCSGFSFIMPFRIVLIGIFGVLYLFVNMQNSKVILNKSPEMFGLLTFIIIIFIGLLQSVDQIETLKFFCVYLVIFVMISTDFNYGFFKSAFESILLLNKIIAISIIINVIIPTLYTDYLYFLIWGGASSIPRLSGEISSGIYSGVVGEKGEAAFLMVVAIIQILSKFVSDKKISKNNMIWLIIFFIALLLPAKRMLFGIGGLMVLIYIMFWIKGKKKIYIFSGFVVLGIIALLIVLNTPSLNTLVMRFLLYSNDDTGNGRIYLWDIAIKMFNEKPLLGYGYGSYNTYASDVGVILSADRTWDSQAHNIYYQLLAEVGILGVITFMFIAITSLVNFIKLYLIRNNINNNDLMLLFLGGNLQVMTLIYGYSGNIIYYTNQIFFYFLGIALIIYLKKKYLNKGKLVLKTNE